VTTTDPYRIEVVPNSSAFAGVFAGLHVTCFSQSPQETWSANAISALLGTPGTMSLIALGPRDEAIGFIIGRVVADGGEVITLCVSPSARRRGIATALIDALKEIMEPRQRIFLEVAITNWKARALYENLGFCEVGRRSAYYHRDGKTVDALVLASDNVS